MKKLYFLLSFLILTALVLFGYYFYQKSKVEKPPAPSPTATPNVSNVSLESQVSQNCKKVQFYTGTNQDIAYPLGLFKKIGADVYYDDQTQSLTSSSSAQFTIQYLNTEGSLACVYVWSGVDGGEGKAAWETQEGEIKTISVNGFILKK